MKKSITRAHRRASPARLALASSLAACSLAAAPAHAAPTPRSALQGFLQSIGAEPVPPAQPSLDRRLITRAEPDECFLQIGYPSLKIPCQSGYKPKTNQAYVWSGVRSGEYAFFGTGANVLCLAAAGYFPTLQASLSENVVCEQAAGEASRARGLYSMGDQRPPKIYRLDATTELLEDKTPTTDPLLATTVGLRGAAAHQDVVLLAGPNLTATGIDALNMWAFEGSTGKLLGSKRLPEYTNLRRGIVVKDNLYLAVRKAGAQYGIGGSIVKWIGDKSDPFRFETVGDLGSDPGYIAEHEGRIVTAGWTGVTPSRAIGEMTSMYLSPPIPRGGLTVQDAASWQKIFSIDQYDPDPVIAHATHFGDLISWQGKLYFSTYQVPMYQTLNSFTFYGRPKTWAGRLDTYKNAERATSMLEMENVGQSGQRVTLLYGEETMPVYNTRLHVWLKQPNKLGQAPKFGHAGFGNRFNYYPWTWTLFGGKLYMATFDGSSAGPDVLAGIAAQPNMLDLPPAAVGLIKPIAELAFQRYAGGDIWRMDSPTTAAVPEDLSGYGNRYNYGIRVWVSFEDKGKMYGGTANPFNLRTGPAEPGGWELIRFTPHQ